MTPDLDGASAAGVTTEDLLVPGADQDIPVRLYRPTAPPAQGRRPLVVDFPGGGWVHGGVGASAWLCSHLARVTGALVAEVGYRLAPEHPAPAAHHDAYAATSWLAEHATTLDARADRLVVLGEGAGGTLAATVALDARQRARPAVALQALLYAPTDLTLTSLSVAESADGPVLTGRGEHSFVEVYLGDLADPRDPLVSPLLADDHARLPPAFVLTAEDDPLRDDGLRYAAALRAAGVPVEHVETPSSRHRSFSLPRTCQAAAEPALAALAAAIRRAVLLHDAAASVAQAEYVSAARRHRPTRSRVVPPTTGR